MRTVDEIREAIGASEYRCPLCGNREFYDSAQYRAELAALLDIADAARFCAERGQITNNGDRLIDALAVLKHGAWFEGQDAPPAEEGGSPSERSG